MYIGDAVADHCASQWTKKSKRWPKVKEWICDAEIFIIYLARKMFGEL